ncbi:hypothetical protein DL93DRAFT_2079025 [Clavulina sp. PMI_390]|nr:hypothetical protein DL93DRAFT_2079025 [Clavulina sp. PMI_390]
MDWMSARLQGLIDQGKKALGKEVVVMDESNAHASEEQGAEDDGSHDWEDDDTPLHRALPPSRPHSSLSHARSNASLASMASMASMVSRAPSVVSRAGSVSVSARDMHAPTTSPYKLGGTAHSSSTASLSAAIPRSNQHTPTHSRYRSVGGAPPSAWSPSQQQHGRGRSHTSSSTHLPLSSSGSFDAGSAKPMPMPRRMTSTATLASVSSRIYGNDADEAVISGSPEMRQFMEQARKARMGL